MAKTGRGPWVFVLKYGLLGWGLSSGLVYFLLEWHLHPDKLTATAVTAVTVFPAMGIVGGFLMWWFGPRKPKQP